MGGDLGALLCPLIEKSEEVVLSLDYAENGWVGREREGFAKARSGST